MCLPEVEPLIAQVAFRLQELLELQHLTVFCACRRIADFQTQSSFRRLAQHRLSVLKGICFLRVASLAGPGREGV